MHWLLAHFIGDWLLQPDSLALKKKEDHYSCLLHVIIYSLVMFWPVGGSLWKILLIATQHYLFDHYNWLEKWLRLTGHYRYVNKGSVMYPLGYIAADQIVHIAWITFVVWL